MGELTEQDEYILFIRQKLELFESGSANRSPSDLRDYAELIVDLAHETRSKNERISIWRRGLDFLSADPRHDVIVIHADLLVDYCQDSDILGHYAERLTEITSATKRVDQLILEARKAADRTNRLRLLRVKGAINRQLARMKDRSFRQSHIRVATQIARLLRENDYPDAKFESFLALVLEIENSKLEKYHKLVTQAQKLVKQILPAAMAHQKLEFIRFYRLHFMPDLAIDIGLELFNAQEEISRRMLRQIDPFIEATVQSWYSLLNLADSVLTKQDLLEAIKLSKQLCDDAIARSTCSARTLVNSIFVDWLKINKKKGLAISLDLLVNESGQVNYSELAIALSRATSYELDPLLLENFNSSAIVCRMATYVKDALEDRDTAAFLYRIAIQLDPTDYVAQTNLARLLLESGKKPDLDEVSRLLAYAAAYSSPRFFWWRDVKRMVSEAKDSPPSANDAQKAFCSLPFNRAISEIRSRSQIVSLLEDFECCHFWPSDSERGRLLEEIVDTFLRLGGDFEIVRRQVKQVTFTGSARILDGLIVRNKDNLVCEYEAKWYLAGIDSATIREYLGRNIRPRTARIVLAGGGFQDSSLSYIDYYNEDKVQDSFCVAVFPRVRTC